MTAPDNFEYRDDSVVAKVTVDLPANLLQDLDQVRDRMSSIRVEQEAMARASGDWNGYLEQIPQIAEQANQAYRNMITQLERMSYIQQELGGHANVGVGGAPMGSQPGGTYNTSAPAGYVDPFMGLPGQGMGGGMAGATGFMQSMMMNDPRMFANMAAQRGQAINPAQLGLIGGQAAIGTGGMGGTGGGMGQGAAAPGSMSPQPTQKARDAAAAPDQTQGGAPTTSEPQYIPADPHPDSPEWQKKLTAVTGTAAQVLAETRAAGNARNGGGILAGGAAVLNAIGRTGGHGGGGNGEGAEASGTGTGWGSIAKGAGLAGGALGLGIMANRFVQNAGEQIQQYSNLGSEVGGGAAEGFGLEMQARTMAMNPFLSLEQSRSIYQAALRSGHSGEALDTMTDFMARNLEEMNMSVDEQVQVLRATVDTGNVSIEELGKTMSGLKDMTRVDGNAMSQSERNAAFTSNVTTLQGAGFEGEQLTQMASGITDMFGDNQQLKNSLTAGLGQNMSNPTFLMTMAQANGVRVSSPEQVPYRLQEQGISGEDAYMKTLQYIAKQAQRGNEDDPVQGASAFYQMTNSMGIAVGGSVDDVYELYMKLIGDDPIANLNERRAEAAADKGTLGEQAKNYTGILRGMGNIGKGIAQGITGNLSAAWGSIKDAGGSFGDFGSQVKRNYTSPEDIVAETERRNAAVTAPSSPLGEGPAQATGQSQRVETRGSVQGEVRIVVDQQGRVTAPPTIQLTGQQKSVNAGYGGNTANNPPPGDPNFNHSFSPFGK